MPHDIFCIPEICTCIVESVRQDAACGKFPGQYEEAQRRRSRTLFALARVSWIFKEPALNALWAHLPDFAPFACLFPRRFVAPVKKYDGVGDERTIPYVMHFDTVKDIKVGEEVGFALLVIDHGSFSMGSFRRLSGG